MDTPEQNACNQDNVIQLFSPFGVKKENRPYYLVVSVSVAESILVKSIRDWNQAKGFTKPPAHLSGLDQNEPFLCLQVSFDWIVGQAYAIRLGRIKFIQAFIQAY